ncbi:alpha-1-antitrypsin homolog [Amia ocellicauda]|uniref:alpha-1-antitrypsin homolog n=1 Tax=Amia ocellicauda TaxID=2972642 RepID=UPI003464598D|nr:A1AT protein [Amia calva]
MGTFLKVYLIATLLCCAVWGDHHHHDDEHHSGSKDHSHVHHKNEGHPHHEEGEMPCHTISPANADFAFSLYNQLKSRPDAESKNIFFSPLSISTALAMLSLGAKGETHAQIFQALGFGNMTEKEVKEGFEHLLHMLKHNQKEMQLEAGNAIVLSDGFKASHQFLADAKHYFESEGFSVDFHNPEVAKKRINDFIARKTHNKITDLVQDLDPSTLMVLLNYMFFRGKWEKPFDSKLTQKSDFHVNENKTVSVDMMKRTGRYGFYYDYQNFTSVLKLPYKGSALMMIILPDEGKMEEVEGFICKEHIRRWHDSLYRSSVDLYLPKFSASATYSLKEILTEMGIVHAFDNTADFSGISEEVKLKVSKATHKAVLNVDEKGTEAAAAVHMDLMPMSLPQTMALNRPFILLILEKTTKSILFMGKITDPTAQ